MTSSKPNKNLSFPGQSNFVVGRSKGAFNNANGANTDYDNISVIDSPANPAPEIQIPLFPDFNTLTCDQIKSHIEGYKKNMADSADPTVKSVYQNGIAAAEKFLISKNCNAVVKPVIKPPSGVPIIVVTSAGTSLGKTSGPKRGNQKLLNVLLIIGATAGILYLVSGAKKS